MDSNGQKLKKGIQLFKQEKYIDAIKVFYDVIKLYKLELKKHKENSKNSFNDIIEERKSVIKNFVNASDCISAAYLKIDQPNKALKYANAMITLQPYGCKGYLRLSKIHLHNNNSKDAFLSLKRGYIKINEIGNNNKTDTVNVALYNQLKHEMKRLKKITESDNSNSPILNVTEEEKIRITKSTDPLKYLPNELIGMIFSQFSLAFNLQCLLVCKNWYEILTNSDLNIFRDFKLKKNIRKQELVKFFNFLNKVDHHKYLNSVNIEPHATVEQSCLTLFFSNHLQLQNFFKINLNQFNYFGLLPYIKNGQVEFSNLKVLNLRIPLYIQENSRLEEIFNLCPKIEKLILIITKIDSRSKNFDGKFMVVDHLKFLNISIEGNLANNFLNNNIIDSFLKNNKFPVLEQLTLSKVKITHETLKALINSYFKVIELQDITGISIELLLDALLEKVEPKKSKLKEIKLIESNTSMESSHRDWRNELLDSKLLYNLNVLILRNSCITPSLLDDILLASSTNIKKLHLLLNRNIIFQNKLNTSLITQTPYGYTNISNLIIKIPQIEELSLVGCSGFNRVTLNELINTALNNNIFNKLNYLNLSLNKLDNEGLIRLFRKPYNLRLERLVIEYSEINPSTVKYLLDNKYCKRIDYKMDERVVL